MSNDFAKELKEIRDKMFKNLSNIKIDSLTKNFRLPQFCDLNIKDIEQNQKTFPIEVTIDPVPIKD